MCGTLLHPQWGIQPAGRCPQTDITAWQHEPLLARPKISVQSANDHCFQLGFCEVLSIGNDNCKEGIFEVQRSIPSCLRQPWVSWPQRLHVTGLVSVQVSSADFPFWHWPWQEVRRIVSPKFMIFYGAGIMSWQPLFMIQQDGIQEGLMGWHFLPPWWNEHFRKNKRCFRKILPAVSHSISADMPGEPFVWDGF